MSLFFVVNEKEKRESPPRIYLLNLNLMYTFERHNTRAFYRAFAL
jgi:hypothetical protein